MVVTLGVVTGCGGGGDDDGAGGGAGGAGSSNAEGAGDADPSTATDPQGASGLATAGELCDGAEALGDNGTVASPELTEISGVAVSRRQPGVLWTHNDSGGGPDVYALGDDGSDRGRFALGAGAEARDWEDMALGPGPEAGVDYLYLGDIGDNDSERDQVVVYRVPEPDLATTPAGTTLTDVAHLTLTYADGAHDAEALLSDPATGDLFVVTKQWDGTASSVFRLPADVAATATADQVVEMEEVGDVPGADGQMVTAGDVAIDGSVVALRTYAEVLLWSRGEGESVADALAGDPCEAPAPFEIQGEAIALSPDGRGYVTIAEGERSTVNRYRVPG